MGFDLYVLRRRHIADIAALSQYFEDEESVETDYEFANDLAELLARQGWERTELSFAEIAEYLGVSEEEARARTPAQLILDEPLVVADVNSVGVFFNLTWKDEGPDRFALLAAVWSAIEAIQSLEEVWLYNPQEDQEIPDDSGIEGLSAAYGGPADGEFVVSDDLARQLNEMVERLNAE